MVARVQGGGEEQRSWSAAGGRADAMMLPTMDALVSYSTTTTMGSP